MGSSTVVAIANCTYCKQVEKIFKPCYLITLSWPNIQLPGDVFHLLVAL
jgi:hypothetical protein